MSEARMAHFHRLDRSRQVEAIRRLQNAGWSEHTIARATGLSVEAIQRVLEPDQAVCSRTGVPMRFCTCAGPHAMDVS